MTEVGSTRNFILLASLFLGLALGGGVVLLWTQCSGPKPATIAPSAVASPPASQAAAGGTGSARPLVPAEGEGKALPAAGKAGSGSGSGLPRLQPEPQPKLQSQP